MMHGRVSSCYCWESRTFEFGLEFEFEFELGFELDFELKTELDTKEILKKVEEEGIICKLQNTIAVFKRKAGGVMRDA